MALRMLKRFAIPLRMWQQAQQASRGQTGGSRNFCTEKRRLSLPLLRVQEALESHPAVKQCEIIDLVAYVVRHVSDSYSRRWLPVPGSSVDDWELQEYLAMKIKMLGYSQDAVPKIRFVDQVPRFTGYHVPFTLIHILAALFDEVDADGNGRISFQAFTDFCSRTHLFNDCEEEAREVFLNARALPSTSEIVFNSGDMFQVGQFDDNMITFYEFQKLVLDAGIVDVTAVDELCDSRSASISHFIDERVVDIVVRRWFSTYDGNGDGFLDLAEYVQLCGDYKLHFCKSEEAFRRLGRNRDGGLDLDNFRVLLEDARVLKTGTSVNKDDEVGQIWRRLADSQRFLPPARVFVADGREGTAPLKDDGSLRFVCVSDSHGQHRELTSKLPCGDVLLHAGDFTMAGEQEEVLDFLAWLKSLPFSRKIVIAGNHELTLDRSYEGQHDKSRIEANAVRDTFAAVCHADESVIYLEDEECWVEGVRIYGSPWQPEFGHWAFNLPRGPALADKWRKVPAGTDILLVHGPPLGRGDRTLPSQRRTGCADLLAAIQNRIRPAFVVCGHMHEGAGVTFDGTTHFLNACSVNEHYECVHAPLVFDMPRPRGKCNDS